METRMDPANHALVTVPNDAVNILDGGVIVYCRGMSFTVGGDVSFLDKEGNTRTAVGLGAGFIHPIRTTRILATGTTATGITVYW